MVRGAISLAGRYVTLLMTLALPEEMLEWSGVDRQMIRRLVIML